MSHFERLYNFACWLTHDPQEAEDLAQEKGFSSFQPGGVQLAFPFYLLFGNGGVTFS